MVDESDFVSGCVNKGTTTPRGTYGITYKERDATLNGENYSSPVKYWMPFNGDIGMHDADWRNEGDFGGDIYTFAEEYYKRLARVVEKTNCDIIAHFDLVSKYNEVSNLFDENHPRYVKAWRAAASPPRSRRPG